MEVVFTFFKPLVRVAPYLLPIYFILLCVIYAILAALSKTEGMTQVFFFLFGFSIGLHLIFGAKSLRSKQADFLKGNYIFGFSFVYLLNLILLALVFSFIIDKFSFVNFCNSAYQAASNIFAAIFKQLFLNKRG
jgi:L-cystine uptake protein TcyP (sodium:dicarboxylate symporter family)